MRIGKEKHEKILTNTIQQLEKEGYNIIRLDGKVPTAISIKDNISYAVCIIGRHRDKNKRWGRTRTIIELEDNYHMFDKIDRIHFDNNKEDRNDVIDKVIKDYEDKGFRIILMINKSPDAIAYRDNNIFAVEILGIDVGCNPKYRVNAKESIYDMFDGVMIKTFNYDNDNVFTETYGRNDLKKVNI